MNQSSSLLKLCLLVILALACWQCANPISPTGGPPDETPPQVDTVRSTPNRQTNFRPNTIEISFDEWVKLKDANQQIIISPPLQGYTTRLKGKTVILDLGDTDTLRNNVTYVIQFGEAVQDLTESNPAEDLRFVFSTGDYIDSLELTGQVVEAYTDEPVESTLVLLYNNLADSVFRTQRPFYFGRTDEQGMFLMSNLRPGDYRIAALQDADANYQFSQVAEKIAFLPEPITISADSVSPISLRLFQEELPLKLNDVDSSRFGLLKLTFNSPVHERLTQRGTADYQTVTETDSVFLWHQAEKAWTLYLSSDTLFYDTIPVPAAPVAQAATEVEELRVRMAPGSPSQLPPKQAVRLSFSRPIGVLDTGKMNLQLDTFPERLTLQTTVDSLVRGQLNVTHRWKENSNYKLQLLPGAVTDFWGIANTDTLNVTWQISELKRFGNIKISFTTASADATYVVKLARKGKAADRTFTLTGNTSYEEQLNTLTPGDYQLEIIEDINNNGRWDSGNYDALRQPERVLIRPLESLRANWDLETEVDLTIFF